VDLDRFLAQFSELLVSNDPVVCERQLRQLLNLKQSMHKECLRFSRWQWCTDVGSETAGAAWVTCLPATALNDTP